MSRQLLKETLVHPTIAGQVGGSYRETIEEVENAAADNALLVVGMAQNPYCKKVQKSLDSANVEYRYLEYGSYFKQWPLRLALKMWSGWPTFPMVFFKGQLVGGFQEVQSLLAAGELK